MPGTTGGWKTETKPSGKSVIKLAVGKDFPSSSTTACLFALADDKTIWYKQSDGWKQVGGAYPQPETIFDLGYDAGNRRDSQQAYILGTDGKFYDLAKNTPSTAPVLDKPYLSKAMTEQNSGWFYAPKNGADNKITGYSGTATETSTSVDSAISSLAYSPKSNAIYAGTNKGLKKLPLNEHSKLTGQAAPIPALHETIGSASIQAVFAHEQTIDGVGYEVIYLGISGTQGKDGLWAAYEKDGYIWTKE